MAQIERKRYLESLGVQSPETSPQKLVQPPRNGLRKQKVDQGYVEQLLIKYKEGKWMDDELERKEILRL